MSFKNVSAPKKRVFLSKYIARNCSVFFPAKYILFFRRYWEKWKMPCRPRRITPLQLYCKREPSGSSVFHDLHV